jgi:tricorn protease
MDLATEGAELSIAIREDLTAAGSLRDVSKRSRISKSHLMGTGPCSARGDVLPAGKFGNTRNLTATPGTHERNSKWSPDGKWIAYISDATGDDELYVMPQDGAGQPVQLTRNGDTYKYQMYWSPDSKKLLWADKKLRLQFVDVESKAVTTVAQATAWEFSDYA